MKSFVFIGTSFFSLECLKSLLQCDNFNLKGIVTLSGRYQGRGLSKKNSILYNFAEDKKIKIFTPNDLSEDSFLKEISILQADFCVVCDYGKILPKVFLNLFSKNILNIHPSLLPLWRGAAPIERALMNGDKKTGVSLQIVAEKLDAGDIVAQQEFDILPEDNAKNLYQKSCNISKNLLQKDLNLYLEGKIQAQAQKEEGKTYAHKIDKKEAQVDWNKPALEIHNQVRALVLGPQVFSFFKTGTGATAGVATAAETNANATTGTNATTKDAGESKKERLKIYKTLVVNHQEQGSYQAGQVIPSSSNSSSKELLVACSDFHAGKALSLLEVQRESKKQQPVSEFLKGLRVQLTSFY